MPKQKWNLAGMSVAELIDLRRQLDGAIGDKISRERSELQTRLSALESLEGGGGRRARVAATTRRGRRANGRGRAHPLKGTKAPIKYRGPNGETWSGRGLAPRWLAELERKGKNRDSYLINKG
jgi:DNA-binding protein H-NS